MALLEGTDVGLGVATLGDLLLRQAGGMTRNADAIADTAGEGGVIHDDAAASEAHGVASRLKAMEG